jgi:hypothetical protein
VPVEASVAAILRPRRRHGLDGAGEGLAQARAQVVQRAGLDRQRLTAHADGALGGKDRNTHAGSVDKGRPAATP